MEKGGEFSLSVCHDVGQTCRLPFGKRRLNLFWGSSLHMFLEREHRPFVVHSDAVVERTIRPWLSADFIGPNAEQACGNFEPCF